MAEELDDNFFSDEPSGIDETDGIFNDDLDDLDEINIDDQDAPSNRPFLLSLLGLFAVGVGAFLCLGVFSLFNTPEVATPSAAMLTQEVEVAKIEATNDAVATQNFYVTQTLDAREANANATATAVASIPTETPVPTETPIPTEAPSPTADNGSNGETEGAELGEDEEGLAESDRAASEKDGAAEGDSEDASSSDGESISTAADSDSGADSSPEQLPDTGFSIINTLALALGLLIILFGARKMRQV